jgi:predicted ATPase
MIEKKAVDHFKGTQSNLIAPLTRFIGRERERAEIKRLLTSTRLLTLTGPGGCGKTRLALQVATELLGTCRDGAWFVDLAPLSQPDLIAQAITSALHVSEQGETSSMATLLDFLAPRQLLLILDNCEHLAAACAWAVETLLQHCPGLQIVVTSREILCISGETRYLVPSLRRSPPRCTF